MSTLRTFIIVVLLFEWGFSQAQVKVTSGFFADSLMVGDHTRFFLTARYPSSTTLLFPDSTFSFSPFEMEKKTFFPTRTADGISYDSVIYTLSTFEIDRVQRLRLPVFEIVNRDSVVHYSPTDSILLTSLVTMNVDTIPAENLPLKVNVAFQGLSSLFNYPVLLIVLAGLIVILVVGWLVFGKRIMKHFRTKRLLKFHRSFLASYSEKIAAVRSTFSSASAETAVFFWKKYMEQLEANPYTKWTTRETASNDPDDAMIGSLKTIDSAIYGYYHDETLHRSFENLKAVADQRFTKKLEEIKNG